MDQIILLPDEKFLPAAAGLIESATRSICIATFKAEITPRPRGRHLLNFFRLLLEKSRSGVIVRFLIHRSVGGKFGPRSNFTAVQEISKHKIAVKCLHGDRCCHAKLLIIDDLVAICGSHNLSVKSCHSNFELSVMFTSPYHVTNLREVFDAAWYSAEHL